MDISEQINSILDKALEKKRASSLPRKYLGASRLGHPCMRALGYEYDKSTSSPGFSGRQLRIFEAGHLFESMMLEMMRSSGFEILNQTEDAKQYGFMIAGGRIGGHVDGIITGAPEHLKMDLPAIWEMKSMNNSSWKDVAKKGVTASRPIYAAQIALYQAYMADQFKGVDASAALFTAINKDTSEIYHELLPFDKILAQKISDRATIIIKAGESGQLLPRGFASPNFMECRICPYKKQCWSV